MSTVERKKRLNEMCEYIYIQAYGRTEGMLQSEIDEMVKHAKEAGAPSDAVCKKNDGTWLRYSEFEGEDKVAMYGAAKFVEGMYLGMLMAFDKMNEGKKGE